MDPKTLRFLIFIAFSLVCLGAGYAARRRGWLGEHTSRSVHLFTLVCLWSPVSLISFWQLPINGQLLLLMLSQPVLMLAGWAVMAPLARWVSGSRMQAGVMELAAALSNQGFTLGAYLCYALLEPGETALFLAIAYVTSMQIFMVLIFYPVAYHRGAEGAEAGHNGGLARTMAGSFLTIRAMPLYAAAAGLTLNLIGSQPPAFLRGGALLEALFFAGAAGSYSGIGLRLRLGDSLRHIRLHTTLAGVKFAAMPLLALALVSIYVLIGVPLSPLARQVILLESFTPAAINTVIISNLFHLDARLASVLWLWNTLLFCLIPLPVLLGVL